jgi:hypothetical protein
MTRRMTSLTCIAIVALSAIAAPSAQAAFVATFEEVGPDVVESGEGTLDLSALERVGGIFTKSFVAPGEPSYVVGAAGELGAIYQGALSGPANWGPGGDTFTKITSGDLVALVRSGEQILVPDEYAGGQLSQSATFLSASFASLGLTPGAYVYSWGTGDHADTFTIDVGGESPVPEPSTWATMLIGFAGLGYAAVRRREAIRASL